MTESTRPLVTVVGATATGKSDLGIALAQANGGEIVNGDALQLYRGMDIGTAKLPAHERGGIPHHLIDVLDVDETSTVVDFQARARTAIAQIDARGAQPVLVGGSGLYVRAVTDDLRFPGTDPDVRARLEAEARSTGSGTLHARLAQRDPEAAATIAPGDARRVVRALEVIEITGEPFTAFLPDYTTVRPTVQIGLVLDRALLHDRIERRVHRMWGTAGSRRSKISRPADWCAIPPRDRRSGTRRSWTTWTDPSRARRRSSARSSARGSSRSGRRRGSAATHGSRCCRRTTLTSSIELCGSPRRLPA